MRILEKTKKKVVRRRRRGRRRKNYYFTQVHEDAIIEYVSTSDNKKRTKLYVELIQPAFNEMVDKIVFTYKFTTLPNVDVMREECKIWLTTILDKYDQGKGYKAFSYFSVITKNWFIHQVKRNKRKREREVYLDDISQKADWGLFTDEEDYLDSREYTEFWEYLWREMESWDEEMIRSNERRVYEAVKILMSSHEDIEIFNKKAIYLYLREITGLNTKQVVTSLNKMRKRYRDWKQEWDEGEE